MDSAVENKQDVEAGSAAAAARTAPGAGTGPSTTGGDAAAAAPLTGPHAASETPDGAAAPEAAQDGTAPATGAADGAAAGKVARRAPKKRFALLVAYCGTGYSGMQTCVRRAPRAQRATLAAPLPLRGRARPPCGPPARLTP